MIWKKVLFLKKNTLLFSQYEGQDVRELKMIFDGQNSIHDTVRHIHRKLDEVIGRQEQTLSQVSNLGRTGGVPQGAPVCNYRILLSVYPSV